MRALETLLLFCNALSLLALAVPRVREAGVPLYLALLGLAVLALHLSLEGQRWQMGPAYLISVAVLGVAIWVHATSGQTAGRGFVALGLGALAFAASVALPLAVPMFSLAEPTGPHAIGSLTYHLWGTKPQGPGAGAGRDLLVQVWYPAEPDPNAPFETYLQDELDFGSGLGGVRLPGFFLNHLTRLETHARRGAAVAAASERYPVLLFSPGANGYRQHNSFQAEDLASHGFVVIGIDHPGAAREVVFPDGRRVRADPDLMDIPRFFSEPAFGEQVFNTLAQDVSHVIDWVEALDGGDGDDILAGRLDTTRVGMFGVSLGGLVAAEACRRDQRLRACLIEDVYVPGDVIAAGVDQPAMWLSRDADSMRAEGWTEDMVRVHQSTMQAAFEGAGEAAYLVHIPGMFHLNYTDLPLTIAAPVARALGLTGAMDWRRGHEIINAYALAFFSRHLKEEPQQLLSGRSERFPEVEVWSRKELR